MKPTDRDSKKANAREDASEIRQHFAREVPPHPNDHKRPPALEDEANLYGNDAMGLSLGAELGETDEAPVGFSTIIDPSDQPTDDDLDEGSTLGRE